MMVLSDSACFLKGHDHPFNHIINGQQRFEPRLVSEEHRSILLPVKSWQNPEECRFVRHVRFIEAFWHGVRLIEEIPFIPRSRYPDNQEFYQHYEQRQGR